MEDGAEKEIADAVDVSGSTLEFVPSTAVYESIIYGSISPATSSGSCTFSKLKIKRYNVTSKTNEELNETIPIQKR